ncbi:MAG: hypothetical protein QXF07_01750 [Candidatus Micrarchaeia archaeon]
MSEFASESNLTNIIAEIAGLSAPFYLIIALSLPIIAAFLVYRYLITNKIVVDKLAKKRLFASMLTAVFSILFTEIDAIGSLTGLEFGQYVLIRRYVGAVAIYGVYLLFCSLIESALKYDYTHNRKRLVQDGHMGRISSFLLIAILIISPFIGDKQLSDFFTFMIAVLLLLIMIIALKVLKDTEKGIKDKTTRKFTVWSCYQVVFMSIGAFFNTVAILASLPPAANLIRIPMSILVAYAAYKVSKNLIKVEEE